MECVQRIVIGSIGHEKRQCGAALFHLFIRIDFVYDCTMWAYVLWRMLQKTKYDLFYLPWPDTGTGEIVFCISYYSTRTWYTTWWYMTLTVEPTAPLEPGMSRSDLTLTVEPTAPLEPGNHSGATRRFVKPRVVPHLAL